MYYGTTAAHLPYDGSCLAILSGELTISIVTGGCKEPSLANTIACTIVANMGDELANEHET